MASFSDNLFRKFESDGYAVIEDVLSASECDFLRSKSAKYIDQLDIDPHPKSIFSTTDQLNDDYFMTSVDKIRFFFEESTFDENGKLVVDKCCSVNKIAHGLYFCDDDYKKAAQKPIFQDVAKQLGFVNPVVVQSMVIFKQPHIGGVVVPHQDGTFLMNEETGLGGGKLMGMWIALEDADTENGCLWFIPGSQTDPITRKMIRNPDSNGPTTTFTAPPNEHDEKRFVPVPVKKGSAVLIHEQVVHKSERNLSNQSREIFAFHIADAHNSSWSKDNWIQPTKEYSFPELFSSEL